MPIPVPTSAETARPPRLMSVDALRGFDMLWISSGIGGAEIATALERWITGNKGWVALQLQHVAWEGMRFEDLIMPLFMFLAGVSLPLAFQARLAKDPSRPRLWRHIAIRIVLLWIFGMLCQGNLLSYDPAQWKFYSNTLQAIAAGYLIASVFHLYLPLRGQVAATAALLLASWAVFAWVPAPGGTAGDYSPGGNIAIWIDKAILGSHQDGTEYAWILGSLNFGATTMLGVFAGRLLQAKELSGNRKALCLAGAGLGSLLLAAAWTPFHPLIKHLWTGSFVFLAGGLSLLLLALFYWTIDVRGWRRWAYVCVVIGVNAIAAYLLTEIPGLHLKQLADPFVRGIQHWGLSKGAYDFVLASAQFALVWLILWHLHRQKIYLKV